MSINDRIKKLEAKLAPPNSEPAEREENFRREVAILYELEDYVPLKDRDDMRRLLEECVPRGLAKHGLTDEEIDEVGPEYVAMFEVMLDDPPGGYS